MKKLCIILFILLTTFSIGLQAQGLGLPPFITYSAQEYKAHSRNFDLECDTTGRVFVANFEGLLMYDGYQWSIFHTPGTTRITAVFRAKNGRIWFGGPSIIGYINENDSPTFLTDENNKHLHFNEVKQFTEQKGQIRFTTVDGKTFAIQGNKILPTNQAPAKEEISLIEGDEILDQLTVPGVSTVYATSDKGLIIHSADGKKTYHITTENQLPSNSINALAYDGRGTIWGATDNGLFKMVISTCYTYYNKTEGVNGTVNCLFQTGDVLLVGTQQGLLVLQNNRISPVPGIHHACWMMKEWTGHGVLIASADGIFIYHAGSLSKLSDKHTISLYVESGNSFLTGELDGVYRHTLQQETKLIDGIPNVSKFQKAKDGSLWLINLDNDTYQLRPGAQHFCKGENKDISNLFSYTDDKGSTWTSQPNGKGLLCSHKDKQIEMFARPMQDQTFSAMLLQNGIAWLGGESTLVRWDLMECGKTHMAQPRLYIRRYQQHGKRLFCAVSNDVSNIIGKILYSYRLHEDDEWSHWTTDQDLELPNLSAGEYEFQVRSKDIFGNIAYSPEKDFEIPQPWYMRWYAGLLYFFITALLIWGFFRWRLIRMHRDKVHLESVVEERTRELRKTQQQLLRKEKEATVGKLTSGLIDRILNPMNYINNFSHLTLGLIKDLREDVEDEQDNMSEDNYEDCQDVMNMMSQNLEKIEQHGLATTRILKAMEEMLKERSGKVEEFDLSALCSGDIEKLNTYYAKDIERLHIQVDWQKPDKLIMANVNADLFSKTLMSLLNNSIYYVIKKADKGNPPADYVPGVRLSLEPKQAGGPLQLHVWDNGMGIDDTIIDKVFDPFFTTKPTNEASGVGLYLSQQIIQDLGGTLTVNSQKGEYTEFIITLP